MVKSTITLKCHICIDTGMANLHKDITGQKFGFVEVVGMVKRGNHYLASCECRNCGTASECEPANLRKKKTDYCNNCKSTHRKRKPVLNDLSKQDFELLHVTRMEQRGDKNGQYYAICDCKCGTKDHPVLPGHLIRGFTTSCGCRRDQYLKNTGENSIHFKGYKEIRGRTWTKWKENAKRRNLEFSLTMEEVWNLFLAQDKRCALSGMPIEFGKSSGGTTVSIDRKDITRGYTIDNVQLVHKHVNTMRNVFPIEYFLEVCNKITEFNHVSQVCQR